MTQAQRKKINTDEAFVEDFLGVLSDLKGGALIAKLIELADFEANRHDIHDGCPNAKNPKEEDGECEDCYSGDTEFENSSSARQLLGELWTETYKFWAQGQQPPIDSSDEGSDEAIEMDDEDDNLEEQDEEGRYVRAGKRSAEDDN